MANTLGNISWLLIFIVAGLGALCAYIGNARTEMRLRTAGLIVLSIGVIMASFHFLIDTDQEKVEHQTRAIIDFINKAVSSKSTQDQDWAQLEKMLDNSTDIELGSHGPSGVLGAKEIVANAKQAAATAGLISLAPGGPHPVVVDTYDPTPTMPTRMIAVSITVVSEQTLIDRPAYSGWEFDWQQRPDSTYYLQRIKLNKFDGQAVQ